MNILNGVYLVRGPSSIRVERGIVEVLGATKGEGGRIVVPSGRSIPVYCEDAVVEVTPQPSAMEKGDPETYKRMSETASLLAESRNPVIIGPSDSGKSTLAVWAYNIAAGRRDSRIMTLDIGQNEIYAPGFAALGKAGLPAVPGGSFDLEGTCFIGSFTPRGNEAKYLYCAHKLKKMTKDWVIVDTDGWVSYWEGISLKMALASILDSSFVALIGLDKRAEKLFRDTVGVDTVTLERPPIRAKDRAERRTHRDRLIARQLVDAKKRPIRLKETSIYWAPLFKGEPLDMSTLQSMAGASKPLYGEKSPEGITIVSRRSIRMQGINTLREGWERGLIASLTHKNRGHLAILEKISYTSMTMSVLTSYQGPIDYVEVGVARVDLDSYML